LTESSNWRKLQTFGVGGVACEVSQMVQQAQGQANHGLALGYDLGPAPEAGGAVPSVAVAPSDGDRQPLDGEHLVDGTTRWQPSRSSVTKALPGSLRQQAASSRPPRTQATMRRLPRPSARPTQSLASFFPGHATSRPSRPCPSARAFIAGGSPRIGVSVRPQPGQQWRWCSHTVFHAVQTTAPLAAQSTYRHLRPDAKAASLPSLLDSLD